MDARDDPMGPHGDPTERTAELKEIARVKLQALCRITAVYYLIILSNDLFLCVELSIPTSAGKH